MDTLIKEKSGITGFYVNIYKVSFQVGSSVYSMEIPAINQDTAKQFFDELTSDKVRTNSIKQIDLERSVSVSNQSEAMYYCIPELKHNFVLVDSDDKYMAVINGVRYGSFHVFYIDYINIFEDSVKVSDSKIKELENKVIRFLTDKGFDLDI